MTEQRPPAGGRVVAELGRPETPEETATRKARDRALRRSRQTTRNLVGALVACVALVLVIVPFLPLGGAPDLRHTDVDVTGVAAAAGRTAGLPLVAPALPSGWQANAAELRGGGGSSTWYVGYVVGGAYAAFDEGLTGETGWVDDRFEGAKPTGTARLGGATWRVVDRRDLGGDAGNAAYGLTTTIGGVPFAVYGTAPAARMRLLAARVAADAIEKGVTAP